MPVEWLLRIESVVIRGSKALMRVLGSKDDDGWTFAERVRESDREEWEAEKRRKTGHGEHLPHSGDAPKTAARPLFRECHRASDTLALYTAHAVETTGAIRAARFEKHVAEWSREVADIMRQQQPMKEGKRAQAKGQPKKGRKRARDEEGG